MLTPWWGESSAGGVNASVALCGSHTRGCVCVCESRELDLSSNEFSGTAPQSLSRLLPDHGGSLRSYNATPGGLNVSHNCIAVPTGVLLSACSNQSFVDDDECGSDDCFHHAPRVEQVCVLSPQTVC